jgi:hypothetical protein
MSWQATKATEEATPRESPLAPPETGLGPVRFYTELSTYYKGYVGTVPHHGIRNQEPRAVHA